jgi:ethylbenzene dehydrogenase
MKRISWGRTIAWIAPLLLLAACGRAPLTTTEVVAVSSQKIPLSPEDPAWEKVPMHVAKLLPQDLVEPRLINPTTAEMRAQAMTDGAEIGFRLSWADSAQDDMPGPGKFIDACAVQIPRKIEPNPPAPQMGETGRTVDIVYWRADWQAALEGKRETINDLYPNARIDHYPFQAQSLEPGSKEQQEMAARYAPAQAAGNLRSGRRASPVECLMAEGPGTLSPAPGNAANGKGARTADGWAVVLTRKLPEGLSGRTRTQIAFAVWQGAQQEAGARKMRTGWIPLSVREAQ